ncbi:MAG TPA: cytochrome c3 family protein, partial [Polyangiaceae bacterium]
ASGSLAYSFTTDAKRIFLPGPTTAGHYQIELACGACHTSAFSTRQEMQAACERCHGEELKEARDSHPESKFTDPRNAERVESLDARYCVTCHREHRPEVTSTMGLSLPADYCYRCHQSIAEERPSHAGMSFEGCADAGCHNFHDNRALYEDLLVRHLDEPAHAKEPLNPARASKPRRSPLSREEADNPSFANLPATELEAWHQSAHALAGVNCSGCHLSGDGKATWLASVESERCGTCHEAERKAFLASRHGMSEAAGLGSMRVASARLPMRAEAGSRELECTSCHGAHRFDTRAASVDACLECHTDEHTRAYSASGHAELWRADPSGRSGASCATCHLPRVGEGSNVRVHHNQNDTLRPNEKMARVVCGNCHGLGFTLDALADRALIRSNFEGKPSVHVESMAMVRDRSRNTRGVGEASSKPLGETQ